MNIIDAAHKTVHAYPGGSESLGPRIGMSPAVLRNKVNPNNTTHHLTIVEASEIIGVTSDLRMLHALANEHGCVVQRVDEYRGKGGPGQRPAVLDLLLTTNACEGAFAGVLQAALNDGLITENEMKAITDAGTSVQTAMVALIARLRAQAAVSPTG